MGMRTAMDPYGSPAVLVDHMLGNAYEVVRFVAKNVDGQAVRDFLVAEGALP